MDGGPDDDVPSVWSENSFGDEVRKDALTKDKDAVDTGDMEWRVGEETDDKGKLLVYRKGVHHSALGTYKGEFVNGKKHGQGSFMYANGDVYVGEWAHNLYNGYGTLTNADHRDAGRMLTGRCYRGQWVAGRRQGHGRFDLGDGSLYDGEFRNNQYHGEGTMTYRDGGTYAGGWVNGRMQGQGVRVLANGDKYEGSFVGGLYCGEGLYVYAGGGFYLGEWKAGVFHGQGKRVYASGASYQGAFVMGTMCGEGVYRSDLGDVYRGFMKDDRFEGHGIMAYADGNAYEGEWRRGQHCGRGKLQYAIGGYYEGQFMAMARAGATGRRRKFASRHATITALTPADAGVSKGDDKHGDSNGGDGDGDGGGNGDGDGAEAGVVYALADGKKHGFGKRVWSSGAEYEGEWMNDTMQGHGVYTSAELPDHAFRYEGLFVSGKFHGKGKATYGTFTRTTYVCLNGHRHKTGNTCVYEGSWARGFQHGNGRMVCCDGRYYHGNFRFGKPHGYGVKSFIPNLERGYRDQQGFGGSGTLYRVDTYHGDFQEGQRHGAGTVTYSNGDVFTGIFEKGHLNGPVKVTFRSGRTVGALFKAGVRLKWTPPEDTSAERALKLLMKFRHGSSSKKSSHALAARDSTGAGAEASRRTATRRRSSGLAATGAAQLLLRDGEKE